MSSDVTPDAGSPAAAGDGLQQKRARTESGEAAEAEPGGDDASSTSSSSRGKAAVLPPTKMPFSYATLEEEVESLRSSPPAYVTEVGRLTRPSVVCDMDGLIKLPEDVSEGPWDLEVRIRGEEGDEAYGGPFRVTLRFDIDLWPSKLAIVRFRGVFHHALVDDSGAMLMPFYRAMPRDANKQCTVALMLQAVHEFLKDPVKAWNIPADKSPKLEASLRTNRKMNQDRLQLIRKYSEQAKHKELFESPPRWRDEWLDPLFAKAVRENTHESWRAILTEHLKDEVFSFKMLSEEFCGTLVEEIFNFYESGLEARRPNSMNAYGIILNEIGLEPLIDELQRMLQPLGEMLFPGAGCEWDGHHCFIVRYRQGEDLGLDMHTDDSDVTFNLCLGLDFTAAGLQFCGVVGAPNHRKHSLTYKHVKGSCVCHLGRKRHGADDIASGERLNLILWNHSSTYRQSDESANPDYLAEESKPDPVCVSYTHDRDFGNFKDYPVGKEKFKGRGWCPRRTFEYPGFEPDAEPQACAAH